MLLLVCHLSVFHALSFNLSSFFFHLRLNLFDLLLDLISLAPSVGFLLNFLIGLRTVARVHLCELLVEELSLFLLFHPI